MEDKVTQFANAARFLAAEVDGFIADYKDEKWINLGGDISGFEFHLADIESEVQKEVCDGRLLSFSLREIAKKAMRGYIFIGGNDISANALANYMTDLYARKNRDYGNSFDKSMDKFGLVVAAIRIGDKVNRLQSLVAKRGEAEVKDESIADTFMDLACYSIMTMMWMRDKEQKMIWYTESRN